MPPGAWVRLVSFDGLGGRDLKRLLAYGLVPGVRVRVVQRAPAVVPLGPFLTVHLLGVIPGTLLARGEKLSALLGRLRCRG